MLFLSDFKSLLCLAKEERSVLIEYSLAAKVQAVVADEGFEMKLVVDGDIFE